MIRYKNREIFRHLTSEFTDKIPINALIEFCNNNQYTVCILFYDDNGLIYRDNYNSCVLDAYGMFISGTGIFSSILPDDDTEELYNKLNPLLVKIDKDEFDIVFINDEGII